MSAAILAANLGSYPIVNGAGVLEAAGSNLPSGTTAGVTAYSSLAAATPNYFPASTVYVVGYIDGTEHARLFAASNTVGATVNYPTLTQITQIFQSDSAGNSKAGGYKVFITPGTNSPDTSSPAEVFLDEDAILLITTNSAFG